MKCIFLICLFLSLYSISMYGQLYMNILDLQVCSQKETIVFSKNTASESVVAGVSVPTLKAKVCLTNISDTCTTLHIDEYPVLISYNFDYQSYKKVLKLCSPTVPVVCLSKGEHFVFEVEGHLLLESFFSKDRMRYQKFNDYKDLAVQILPTLKFAYIDYFLDLELLHTEVKNATISL